MIKRRIAKLNPLLAIAVAIASYIALCASSVAAVVEPGTSLTPNPAVTLTKSSTGAWQLDYALAQPATKLVFVRNPDQTRLERWTPLDTAFLLAADESGEYIVRRDGKPFSQLSIALTPTYRSLVKDYAPFSPYSDGGSLVYSGRFFACADSCEQAENSWQFTLVPPAGEHVIVNGALHLQAVTWLDDDSGRNIYVGKQQPVAGSSFVAVIDDKLPAVLKDALQQQLPRLMNYFAGQLGDVAGDKPMLFASYANTPGSSSQGGTLPNQIFMHWDFDDLPKRVEAKFYVEQTFWFFAHEAAHFFQRSPAGNKLFGEAEQSWLHEGGADWLAQTALQALYPEMQPYIDVKVGQYRQHCDDGLAKISLANAASAGQFMLYYSCGYFIHQALDQAIRAQSNQQYNIMQLWRRYGERVDAGASTGADTFWLAAADLISAESLKTIKAKLAPST